MSDTIDTPRTEAARIHNADLSDQGSGLSEMVHADFARGLERELAAERECRRALASGVRQTLIDLPMRRDWLDPRTETLLRATLKASTALDTP